MWHRKKKKERKRKKNNTKYSGHFVSLQRLRAAHTLCSDQNIFLDLDKILQQSNRRRVDSQLKIIPNPVIYRQNQNPELSFIVEIRVFSFVLSVFQKHINCVTCSPNWSSSKKVENETLALPATKPSSKCYICQLIEPSQLQPCVFTVHHFAQTTEKCMMVPLVTNAP